MLMKTATAFFVAIFLNGEEVTRVGPFTDAYGCETMQRDIENDVRHSFEHTTPYGIGGDIWGIGGGAIFRFKDYEFPCMIVRVNIKTGEVLSEKYFR